MTSSDPSHLISVSAFRQLLSAAADAGLSNIISVSSVQNDGDHVVITISAREVRALTNWFVHVAESHSDAPITANTVCTSPSQPVDDSSWMRDVTDTIRIAPVGYESVSIPTHNKGTDR